MNHEANLLAAKQAISKLPLQKVFEVKDLFEGATWKGLTRGEKISFGRYSSIAVAEGRIRGIEKLERGKDNHSRYKKIQI